MHNSSSRVIRRFQFQAGRNTHLVVFGTSGVCRCGIGACKVPFLDHIAVRIQSLKLTSNDAYDQIWLIGSPPVPDDNFINSFRATNVDRDVTSWLVFGVCKIAIVTGVDFFPPIL